MSLQTANDAYPNEPKPVPADPAPIVDVSVDAVVGNDEEQRALRESMEGQLRSQRGALDPQALHGKHSVPGAAPTTASEQERVRGEMLSEDQLLSYRGKLLLDANGEEIGPISSIYLDEATAIPKWVGAQVGSLMGSQRVVAPVFGSYTFRDAISAPYSRQVILGAEVSSEGALTSTQDGELYLHYGIPTSNELSASGLPAGMDATRLKGSRWLQTPLARNLRQAGGQAIAATRRVWRWPWSRVA